MPRAGGLRVIVAGLAATIVFVCTPSSQAQSSASTVYHQIDGRLRTRSGQPTANIHVRLLREATRRPIGETFSRSRGEFEFNYVVEGQYIIETYETTELEATSTSFQVRPLPREKPAVVHVEIDIPYKPPPSKPAPGVIAADIDPAVPKEALKNYRAATKALAENDSERAIAKFQEAIKAYPQYYAARLDLGREFRRLKRFKEAEEVFAQLSQLAPKHAEPLIEHARVFLDLQRRADAASKLQTAIKLEEANWAAHFYLGWALIEEQPDKAEIHFKRAIELDEQKAARGHLALGRLADARGERELAIKHLEAYLVLIPSGAEADIARSLAARLRTLSREGKGNSPRP